MDYIVQPVDKKRDVLKLTTSFNAIDYPRFNLSKKKVGLTIWFLLSSVGSIVFAQNNMIDGVVWIVGDEVILKSDVEEQRLRMQYEGTRMQGDPYCLIPEQIAIQK